MFFAVLSALLCISSGATFIGHSQITSSLRGTPPPLEESSEYPTSEDNSKMLVLEPPLIKRSIDPLSIPRLIREPPLKRGDKRDSYFYPSTSSQLSDRIPVREPPLKRSGFDSESQDAELFRSNYLVADSNEEEETSGRSSYLLPTANEPPATSQDILRERSSVRKSLLSPPLFRVALRQWTPSAAMKPFSINRLWR